MSSVLNTVCRKIATPVTQRSESPYFTNAAGPSRNSPLPIARPRTMTPGPTTASHPSPRGVGAAGRSARVQGSRPDRASMGTAACSGAAAAVVVTRTPLDGPLHASSNWLSGEGPRVGIPAARHQGVGVRRDPPRVVLPISTVVGTDDRASRGAGAPNEYPAAPDRRCSALTSLQRPLSVPMTVGQP